jgi:DivIVA domain-containing protein
MRRKKGREQDQETPATGDPRISPAEVQGVEFKLAFRGYSERDVDAFLDRVTEDLSSYLDENAGLRQGLPIAAASAGSAGDEADLDATLAAAREEAAAIIRRAEQDAAAIRAAAGSRRMGDPRAAVAPFLNTEREFLQSLGSLVQTHAEEIKQMVLAIRARTEAAAAVEKAAVPAVAAGADRSIEADLGDDDATPREPTPFEPATTAEMRERMGADPALTVPDSEPGSEEPDPIVVDSATEPVFSTEGSPGSSPAGDRRERSLRELFWGED